VKPDPNDTLNRSLNQMNGGMHGYYGDQQLMQANPNQVIYMNGNQAMTPEMQHQYAVVKKSGSKRDITNLERENPAIFKVIKVFDLLIVVSSPHVHHTPFFITFLFLLEFLSLFHTLFTCGHQIQGFHGEDVIFWSFSIKFFVNLLRKSSLEY
jgi:hypothetical protein